MVEGDVNQLPGVLGQQRRLAEALHQECRIPAAPPIGKQPWHIVDEDKLSGAIGRSSAIAGPLVVFSYTELNLHRDAPATDGAPWLQRPRRGSSRFVLPPLCWRTWGLAIRP
jgi:hypothetical protein